MKIWTLVMVRDGAIDVSIYSTKYFAMAAMFDTQVDGQGEQEDVYRASALVLREDEDGFREFMEDFDIELDWRIDEHETEVSA